MGLQSLISTAIFQAGGFVLKGGKNARLSILIYHRVLSTPDPLLPYEVDVIQFRQQMNLLAQHCHVLPLREAVDRLASSDLPPRSACITFDDGYRDNAENALPILNELGLTATFFIATGFLNGGIMFNDSVIEGVRRQRDRLLDLSEHGLGQYPVHSHQTKLETIKQVLRQIKYQPLSKRLEIAEDIFSKSEAIQREDLMMDDGQVVKLRHGGMSIGGHTRNHPILAKLPQQLAEDEIRQGKQDLEDLLREPIDVFAYPNGRLNDDYTQTHVDIVKRAGFKAAVSTNHGVSSQATDPYQLARFTPWDRPDWRFALRLVDNGQRVKSYENHRSAE